MSSRPFVLPLDVPLVAPNDGEAVTVYHLTEKVVQCYAYGTGTYSLQISLDGTNWTTYASITAVGMTPIPFYAQQVRLRCAVNGTATSMSIAGVQPRD